MNPRALVRWGGALIAAVALPAHAASPDDELQLMTTRNDFVAAHPASGAYVGGHDELSIDQGGSGDVGYIEQTHSDYGIADLKQRGDQNAAGIVQAEGSNNSVQAQQLGQSNFMDITQSGVMNSANLTQNSDGNRLRLDQENGYNTANVTQSGYSVLNLQQAGNDRADVSLGPAPYTLTIIQPPGDTVSVHSP